MHFFKSIAAATVAFAAASMAQEYTIMVNSTQSGLNVNSDLGNTELVSYANSSIWIGGIKSATYSEPFLVQGETGFSFTSWHSVPTGWQKLYIFPNETQPVQFTIPHGGSIPEGAVTDGFAWTANGLTLNGENNFIGCKSSEASSAFDTYEIYWAGAGSPAGVSCTGPLYLYKFGSGSGCSTVG